MKERIYLMTRIARPKLPLVNLDAQIHVYHGWLQQYPGSRKSVSNSTIRSTLRSEGRTRTSPMVLESTYDSTYASTYEYLREYLQEYLRASTKRCTGMSALTDWPGLTDALVGVELYWPRWSNALPKCSSSADKANTATIYAVYTVYTRGLNRHQSHAHALT
jgi:hypothetical protein